MKHFEAIYSKGHLVDKKTGQRIVLNRGASFTIQGDDDSFGLFDDLMQVPIAKNEQEKREAIVKRFGENVIRIATTGQVFEYKIGISKRTEEDRARQYFFEAELLEDLYLKPTKKGSFQLCDCLCVTTNSLDHKINLYEPVYGTSLSNLFGNMVAFYFNLQRSGAANAFTTFKYVHHKNPGDEYYGYYKNMLLEKPRAIHIQ